MSGTSGSARAFKIVGDLVVQHDQTVAMGRLPAIGARLGQISVQHLVVEPVERDVDDVAALER